MSLMTHMHSTLHNGALILVDQSPMGLDHLHATAIQRGGSWCTNLPLSRGFGLILTWLELPMHLGLQRERIGVISLPRESVLLADPAAITCGHGSPGQECPSVC